MDMFLSRRVAGVRASIFHCSQQHLRKVCSLHGLDVTDRSNSRDVKIRLLYHVINGDCLAQRCEPSRPSPDRSACRCVAVGFPSAFSMTTFVINLIKSSPPSKITTEDLLIVVESTGIQSPYESKVNLRRQLCLSLQYSLYTECQTVLQPIDYIFYLCHGSTILITTLVNN
jgi:hypothetical protein